MSEMTILMVANSTARPFRVAALTLGSLLGLGAALSSVGTAQAGGSPQVVELYTSQGCSSCPPADRLMATLADRSDLVALSFNVDYWDYLGWRDTLAKREFSNRQRRYARTRGDGNVYTPQMIINGQNHIVGSDRRRLSYELGNRRFVTAQTPDMRVKSSGKLARIEIGNLPGWRGNATIWAASVKRKVVTSIKRGENRGRRIAYYNVVRDLVPIGTWTGQELTLQIEPDMILKEEAEALAVLVQNGETGRMLTASWVVR